MIDLYYWPTPSGQKISIALEEMGLAYQAVNIGKGDRFKPDFLFSQITGWRYRS